MNIKANCFILNDMFLDIKNIKILFVTFIKIFCEI